MELILGQTLALFTAFCFAQNSLIYAHVGAIVSSSTTAHIRLWIAVPLILLVHLISMGTIIPHSVPLHSWVLIGISGALGFCIADLFIFSALVKLGARQTMVIMTTSPLFSTIFAYFLEGEVITLWQAFGMIITLSGVAAVILVDRNKKEVALKKNIETATAKSKRTTKITVVHGIVLWDHAVMAAVIMKPEKPKKKLLKSVYLNLSINGFPFSYH